jgi:hypothetical protein
MLHIQLTSFKGSINRMKTSVILIVISSMVFILDTSNASHNSPVLFELDTGSAGKLTNSIISCVSILFLNSIIQCQPQYNIRAITITRAIKLVAGWLIILSLTRLNFQDSSDIPHHRL